MKKRDAILILFFLLLPIASAEWFYDSEHVYANFDISSSAEIVPSSSNYRIEHVSINLTFFPKEYNDQKILSMQIEPDFEKTDNEIKFRWERPNYNFLDFKVNADVKKTNIFLKIDKKIKFPIDILPGHLAKYIEPSETIDSDNEDIIKLASKIVEGEDDLYIAVYKIADWTKNNINYNLSTLTEKISQKASWVLANKQGVCDELTSLFIALLRAVGVPARFVSGISYTNSPLFPENWGAHGWAEVYFPGYGWLPYDVTYGQFGYVDAAHFKFKETADSDEAATYYNWLGRNVELRTKELDIKTKLISYDGKVNPSISLSTYFEKPVVSFGSYNILWADFYNQNEYYTSTDVYLSTPKEVEIINGWAKSVVLSPRQKKSISWILKVDGELDKDLIYTMPVIVSTNSLNATDSFQSSVKGVHLSYDEAFKSIKEKQEEISKTYSANAEFKCSAGPIIFYIYENKSINCTLRNLGNVFLENISICIDTGCMAVNIGVSQQKDVQISLPKKMGVNYARITAKNEIISKSSNVEYEILDEPEIIIRNITTPKDVRFDEKFNISFIIGKDSLSNPLNINVSLRQNHIIHEFKISELFDEREFYIDANGNELFEGYNPYTLSVAYHDTNNRTYNLSYSFGVELTEVTLWQKLRIAINQFQVWVSSFDIEMLVKFFIFSILTFLVVYWYALRHK